MDVEVKRKKRPELGPDAAIHKKVGPIINRGTLVNSVVRTCRALPEHELTAGAAGSALREQNPPGSLKLADFAQVHKLRATGTGQIEQPLHLVGSPREELRRPAILRVAPKLPRFFDLGKYGQRGC